MTTSGIPPESAIARGYQSLSGSLGYECLRQHGFSKAQAENLPGLLLPVWSTQGTLTDLAVYRPDAPRMSTGEGVRKYEFPRGQGMRLDCPPACAPRLGAPDVPLWITEGQKKGDALAAQGACALVLLGVDCWRGKNPQGGTTALADWDYVHLRNREVIICYDSDLAAKPQIKGAMRRLANFLRGKQGNVSAVLLPQASDGGKQGIDDYLVAGHTLEEARQLAVDPWEGQPTDEESAATARKAALPQIRLVPGELSTLVIAAEHAILDWQARRQPVLFQRAGHLCFIVRDAASPHWLQRPPDLPQIQLATRHKLRALCNETASWWKWDGRSHGWKADVPPHDIVQTLLERGEWNTPPLQGIATRPFFRPNGTLCQTPGYDSVTGIFLEPTRAFSPLLLPQSCDLPTAQHALQLLQTLFADFPFTHPENDFAATLAALLTLIARPAIDGQVPLFAVTSSTPGSGKGLLVDLLTLIAIGEMAPRWAPTRESEEERKRLMTIALAGEQVALIDNVQGLLGSEALDMAITSGMVSDRALGSHTLIRAPLTTVFFATGNNIGYRSDMARRVCPISLSPTVEHPEERIDFAQPQIRRHCRREQTALLTAACTIFSAYLAEGAPPPATGAGSFEEWSALIRGCVIWVTGTDPLAGRNELLPQDPDLDAWGYLLASWQDCLGAQGRTVGMVLHEIEELAKGGILDDHWRALREALAGIDAKGDGTRLNARSIGWACTKYHGRIVGGRQLVSRGEYNRLKVWGVVSI